MKKGKIIPNDVILEKHEYKTVLLFTEMGVNIELIPKSLPNLAEYLISKND